MSVWIPMDSLLVPSKGFLDEELFNNLLVDVSNFTDVEYKSNIDKLLHPDMIEIVNSCDYNDKSILQKGIATVIYKTFGGETWSMLDDDKSQSGNSVPRRLIYKIKLNDNLSVVAKVTQLEKKYNIKAIDQIYEDREEINTFVKYTDLSDKYLGEAEIYKLTSEIRHDKNITKFNDGEPVFFKFYDWAYVDDIRRANQKNIRIYDSVGQDTYDINNIPNGQIIGKYRNDINSTYLISFMEDVSNTGYIECFDYFTKYADYNDKLAVYDKMINLITELYNTYNFVHWDLHMGNFMVHRDNGTVKIYDFDWATIYNVTIPIEVFQNDEVQGALRTLQTYRPPDMPHDLFENFLGHARDIAKLEDMYFRIKTSNLSNIVDRTAKNISGNSFMNEIILGIIMMPCNTKNYFVRMMMIDEFIYNGILNPEILEVVADLRQDKMKTISKTKNTYM